MRRLLRTCSASRCVPGRPVQYAAGVGAASWILYPGNEPVTMWQVDVLSKEVLVHTGKTVPMLSEDAVYRDHLYEMM